MQDYLDNSDTFNLGASIGKPKMTHIQTFGGRDDMNFGEHLQQSNQNYHMQQPDYNNIQSNAP